MILKSRGHPLFVVLRRPAADITIDALVRATEDNLALVPCFELGDTSCPLYVNCGLARTLDDALGAFFTSLRSRTLADLL